MISSENVIPLFDYYNSSLTINQSLEKRQYKIIIQTRRLIFKLKMYTNYKLHTIYNALYTTSYTLYAKY